MMAYYEKKRRFPPGFDVKMSNDGNADPNQDLSVLANSEEASLARVGPDLYEAIFKHYTKKQWDKYPSEIDASVMMRLPCRTNTDERYFPDQFQGLPYRGYVTL